VIFETQRYFVETSVIIFILTGIFQKKDFDEIKNVYPCKDIVRRVMLCTSWDNDKLYDNQVLFPTVPKVLNNTKAGKMSSLLLADCAAAAVAPQKM
jgi:hypothetical protein